MRDYIKLGGILFVITLVVALMLGYANKITAPKIEQLTASTKSQGVSKVIVGEIDATRSLTPSNNTSVKEISQCKLKDGKTAYAVSCSPTGYAGEISMMVGLDDNLSVTGVTIISMNETAGLGTKANEPSFIDQFKNKKGEIEVAKNSPTNNQIQAISGATITSKAVTKGVNDAISEVKAITGGGI